ncbi:MAG: pyridoxamine 5'-phosphate oxidase family protein [Desulfobacula sp.]|jgi:nitroimidazol reductase NimA-like FMN-containing flavoprotein (pyridoxamine 5'-phosphate oxidase superfamily)|uniref:pyridoxamine 5'-phosphate oxidase family protein n=1 Tax=Desulfobacula sp. TaxID=2593537 RepID=UPI001DDB7CB7|nr:pyridoxamine 5'-phosphate oxidase family protein [Desulfobacula sp.]MBT3484050.1 pyridoxamine 5'-phosphate oxidase family protein [Desulfobacula sp.]MBT3805129.1 pyridoxamine 5'-phosphate oxidase family protein [Desulfobacula sp.]MBT4026047.1 pyridoxamine 5'-phosphate oxidase family protein [Desulfobacula sp.]MBT4199804.1 pyridoxamine 5'-phosphate oxidase family protein [Desulfobacula sp.]
MRRKEKEITITKEIEKILKESKVCRLAMVDEDKPYIVPMNFGYSNGYLFFHSAKQGRKIDLMKKNPNICFEVDELIKLKKASLPCDWGIDFKSVIGSGKAQFLEDLKEKIQALNMIMSQYSDRKFEYPDEMLEKTAVIKVVIDEMTGKQS